MKLKRTGRERPICHLCGGEVGKSGYCLSCAAFVRTDDWQVDVSGSDADKVQQVATELSEKLAAQYPRPNHEGKQWMKSAEYIETLGKTWRIIAFVSCAFGIVLAIGGIVVAIIGHQAETTMKFLGNELSTTSVGIGLAFLGAVVLAVGIRRILKSVDHATSSDADPRP